MNFFADIPGDYNVMLAFTDILAFLLTIYMGFRLFRRMSLLTALFFLLQLFILTSGVLAFFNRVIVVPAFEIALMFFGVMIPLVFLFCDYSGMKRRIKSSKLDEPLIARRTRNEKARLKFRDFIEEAEEWKTGLGADIVAASLKMPDRKLKSNVSRQIYAVHKLIESGDFTGALELYRVLAGIVSGNPFIICNAAWLMRKNGLYAESLKYHKKALILAGDEEDYDDEDQSGGEEEYRSSRNMDTLLAVLHFGCGICYYSLEKYEFAIKHFIRAKYSMPELREADINIAKSYMALNNRGEAEKHIKAALEEREDTSLRFLLARVCSENGKEMECKYHLERIVEADPDFTEAWELLGKVYRKTGDWKGASLAYRKLTQIEPQGADYYYRLGVSLRQDGRTDEAFSNFRMASEIDPTHSRALYSMASILDAQGKSDRAIECLVKSLAGSEKLEMAYNLLAEIYISLDRVYDAVRVYEEASVEHGSSYVIHYNLGVTLMMVKRYEEAVRVFKRAQKITPDDPALYYNWASAAISLKDYGEAAKLYKEGLRFKPDDDEILFGLARVSAISGDVDATLAFLSRAFEINPGMRLRAKASHDFAMFRTLPEFMEITRLPEREERMHA
jgi:tetratricopeptide (TPR) repeat protein